MKKSCPIPVQCNARSINQSVAENTTVNDSSALSIVLDPSKYNPISVLLIEGPDVLENEILECLVNAFRDAKLRMMLL